ncbi:NYN domain-containing protein [Phormidesmis sp. 146-35]
MMNMQNFGNSTPSCALYWDWQNVRCTDNEADYLLSWADIVFNLKSKKAYAYWRRENEQREEFLYKIGLECVNIPSRQKNSVDDQLIQDCRSQALNNPQINVVILVSGDKDFAPLVRDLKAKGKWVIIIAQGNVSKKLRELANEFYYVSELFKQAA